MSYYQLIGYIFKLLVIICPIYLVLFKYNDITHSAIKILLCLGCTFCYDYRIFSISLLQILLVLIPLTNIGKFNSENYAIKKIKLIVFVYLCYMVFMTFIGYFLSNGYKFIGSIVQNQLRPVVQSVQHVFTYLTFFVALSLNGKTSRDILKSFYIVLKIIAIVAILQSVIYKITNFDIIPMRKDFISEENGLSVVAKNGFLRATAGIGEPKQLAKFLAIGMAFNILGYKILDRNRPKLFDCCLFLLGLYFTYSTTGYMICAVVLLLYCIKAVEEKKYWGLPVIVIGIVGMLALLSSPIVVEKLEAGLSAGEVLGLEDSDSTVVYWLKDNPFYILFGVGIANVGAYAYPYVPISRSYVLKRVFTLRRGFIRFLADGGIICLAFQIYLMSIVFKKIKMSKTVKYLAVFFLLLFFILTCEALFELELTIIGLLFSIAIEEGKINENHPNKYGLFKRINGKNCTFFTNSVR